MFFFSAPQKPIIKSSTNTISELSRYVKLSSNVGTALQILESSSVKISCTATGIPKPTYSWYYNNEPIVNTDRRFYNKETGLLVIRDIRVEETGTFRCEAVNNAGRDVKDSKIEVYGKI